MERRQRICLIFFLCKANSANQVDQRWFSILYVHISRASCLKFRFIVSKVIVVFTVEDLGSPVLCCPSIQRRSTMKRATTAICGLGAAAGVFSGYGNVCSLIANKAPMNPKGILGMEPANLLGQRTKEPITPLISSHHKMLCVTTAGMESWIRFGP